MAFLRSRALTCRQVVDLVTDYLEEAMSPADRRRFEQHLDGCVDCATYLEQLRTTLAVLGSLAEDSIEPDALDELSRRLAGWSTAGE
jgi:hypothetical protein